MLALIHNFHKKSINPPGSMPSLIHIYKIFKIIYEWACSKEYSKKATLDSFIIC